MTPDHPRTASRSLPGTGRARRGSTGRLRFRTLASLAAGAAVLVSCGGSHLTSRWRDRAIAVDGDASDWDGALTTVKDGGFQIGAENDGESLYLCLRAPADEQDARRLARGFTVWLDPAGGKEHALGVRFPPAFAGRRMSREPGEEGAPPDTGEAAVDRLNDRIRVVHGDEDAATLGDLVAGTGVEARMGGALVGRVYELRVPLVAEAGQGTGLPVRPGSKIGLGLETTTFRGRSGRGPRMGGGGGFGGHGGIPGGGFGGEGGGFGGRGGFGGGEGGFGGGEGGFGGHHGGGMGGPGFGGGQGPRGGRNAPDPIKVWTTLTLAGTGSRSGKSG
jgi:hypothetical protein